VDNRALDPDAALLVAWNLGMDDDGWTEEVTDIAERLLPTLIEAGFAETTGHTWRFTRKGIVRAEELESA